jgi:hypothetical protein
MSGYPLRFYGWQPSAEGGWGVTEWELPEAVCPRTKGAVPADEVVWRVVRHEWGEIQEPHCKRCGANLMEEAYPVDAAERVALFGKWRWWKGLRTWAAECWAG